MKNKLYLLPLLFLALLSSCYKDLGNYEYNYPADPVVTGLKDTVYVSFIGDTLRITPQVKHTTASENLSFQWKIMFPYEPWEMFFEGAELKMPFTLQPGKYRGLFIITDKAKGMKYYHDFEFQGVTRFTTGTVVLSEEEGTAQLSFIDANNILLPKQYEVINQETLPGKPLQLLAVNEAWQPNNLKRYWILCEGEQPGVLVDASTLIRYRSVKENFFDPPAAIQPGYLNRTLSGVATGVINGRLYSGTTNTAPFSPYYGMFGNDAPGDYELSPKYIFTEFQYYVGFDLKKKRFVQFSSSGSYQDTSYIAIKTGPGFNPKNPMIDLIHMQYINGDASYAFAKDVTGKIVELKFFNAPNLFFASYSRPFAGANLLRENTKWAGSTIQEVIYFSSGDQIYRYNPSNEQLRTLDTKFDGKDVSMLKVSVTGDTLITGAEGSLYFLDVSTGKNGRVINRVDGIPGKPVDVAIRKQ